MKFEINIGNREAMIISAVIVAVFLVGISGAYNAGGTGGNPSVMGHSTDEINWSQPIPANIGTSGLSPNCPNTGWGCGVHTKDLWAELSVRTNTLCLGGGSTAGSTSVGSCRTSWPSVTVSTGDCIHHAWGSNFMCEPGYVVSGANYNSGDSYEWTGFWCCRLLVS